MAQIIVADPKSVPSSMFTVTPTNASQVNGPYIGGIMEDDGVTPTYPRIHAVYKNEYQKK